MLNSERIFSDSRTRAGIEDAFFRRAMALYCENESKKVIAEIEASGEEAEVSAKPLFGIFAKLRRERGFSSAFRIAKKVTDRVALLVLAAVIVFAGAVTASASPATLDIPPPRTTTSGSSTSITVARPRASRSS